MSVVDTGTETRRYRMKDLCQRTGLDRQAIHYYIREELLPPGHKTGRNTAWYDDDHLRRLEIIQRLQHERFLPLRAIKAVLDEEDAGFSNVQREFLAGIRGRLHGELSTRAEDAAGSVPLDALVEHAGLDGADLRALLDRGELTILEGEGGALHVAERDAWKVELWGAMRAAGFTRELGFEVSDVELYDEAIRGMVRAETARVASRLGHLPPADVAAMIERALPLVQMMITRLHTTRIRELLQEL